jgi:hypothetical protein
MSKQLTYPAATVDGDVLPQQQLAQQAAATTGLCIQAQYGNTLKGYKACML